VKQSHRILFLCIGALSLATFLFAVLQFVTLTAETPAPSSETGTNTPATPES
jgi:hypothetical protein